MLIIDRTKPKNEHVENNIDDKKISESHEHINKRIDELDAIVTNLTFGGDI